MLLLGLLLLCGTAAFTGLLIADNLSGGPDQTIVLFGSTTATMNSLEIFLSGAALALIFALGLVAAGVGATLFRRRRAQLRDARRALARQAAPGGGAAASARTSGKAAPGKAANAKAKPSARSRLLQRFGN